MFEPVRGGTRGGQAEFKWSDVSADKDREVGLSPELPIFHDSLKDIFSVRTISDIVSMHPPGGGRRIRTSIGTPGMLSKTRRRGLLRSGGLKRLKRKLYPQLCEILEHFLITSIIHVNLLYSGFAPSKTGGSVAAAGAATGANAVAVPPSATTSDAQRTLEKEEKKRRKAEKKEEKRFKKERRAVERARSRSPSRSRDNLERSHRRLHTGRSRSRSPVRRRDDDSPSRSIHLRRNRSRSRTPPHRLPEGYGDTERERERERDRRRWDENARRQQPGSAKWGRA